MGKKSRKGTTRAGTKKHSAAGQGVSSLPKSDAGSVVSKVSKDALSVDTPFSTENKFAPSNLPAPTGPPPKDVMTFVNSLVQNAVNEAASAKENKENPAAEPEEVSEKANVAPEPVVAVPKPQVKEEIKQEVATPVVAAPAPEVKEPETPKEEAPVVQQREAFEPAAEGAAEKAPEEAKPDVWSSKLRDVVTETEPVMAVTPPRNRAVQAPIPNLATPDKNDVEVKQNECGGCIIL